MTVQSAELAAWAPRCLLGESPRWYDGRWWWIDATVGDVFRYRPGEEPATPWRSLGQRVSLVHPASPRGILVAVEDELRIYPDDDGAEPTRTLAALGLAEGWNLNDGAGAPGGGLYIGVVSPDRNDEGYLLRVRSDGSLGGLTTGVHLSNGLAFDGSVLYHADSLRRRVTAYRLDPNGEIVDRRTHLSFDDGLPDGIATDESGALWVALYGLGEVRRYTPDGQVDLTLTVPTPQVTAIALGGPDGRDVLITTAREGYDDARSAAEPMAGRLFSARAPVAGRPVTPVVYQAHP